jgi:hypothetical protein
MKRNNRGRKSLELKDVPVVCTENLTPDAVVMKSAKYRM